MKSQLIALAAAALLAAAGVSQAQDANPSSSPPSGGGGSGGGVAGIRSACAADVQKMCPSVADAAGYRQCLTDNYASLSDGCKSAISAYQSSMQSSGGSH
jgi:hypothetical protein